MSALARDADEIEPPDRERLLKHLVETRIAGEVATPRENNLLHYRLLADRDPYYMFGLEPSADWTRDRVLDLMAEKAGVDPRLNHREGPDTIDPQLTVTALDRYAERLGAVARSRGRVLLATGHPGNLSPLYQRFAAMLAGAGCTVLEAGRDWSYEAATPAGRRKQTIHYYSGVGMMLQNGSLVHTHAARPIRAALNELVAAGQPLPDLVIADHGWCGGAAQAGVDAIGFADSNDPALFVGEAEGTVRVAVPLDDGLAPRHYAAVGDYVLARAALV
jgi:Phosphatase